VRQALRSAERMKRSCWRPCCNRSGPFSFLDEAHWGLDVTPSSGLRDFSPITTGAMAHRAAHSHYMPTSPPLPPGVADPQGRPLL